MEEEMEDWRQCPKCREWAVEIDEHCEPNSDDPSCGIWLDASCTNCGWEGQVGFYYKESWTAKKREDND